MRLYTYDEWISGTYTISNDKEILQGQTRMVDLTSKLFSGSRRELRVDSVFRSKGTTLSAGSNSFVFQSYDIDCDIGCLYLYDRTYEENNYAYRDCIQCLNNRVGYLNQYPYIYLDEDTDQPNTSSLRIDLGGFRDFKKILIFQSIYSGAITFKEASTQLRFKFIFNDDDASESEYDYVINTNLYNTTSQMIVGAILTFETYGKGINGRYKLNIQNISEFVYGHVDMNEKFNWGLLWRCFQPPKNADAMPSSIMHYAKT